MNNYSDTDWDALFENLIDDIEEQKCVLLIGPEIIRIHNFSLQQYIHGQVRKSHADQIAYYYERDGFFMFKDPLAKEDVQRAVRRNLKSMQLGTQIDESIYLKIAAIPFHLVLSVNPDNLLSDVAFKYGIRHRFAFFHHRGDGVQEVEAPTRAQPLYFNLCGSKLQDDSLILDYDDVYRMLQTTFGAPGLPERLRRTLLHAKTFLFLGFQFDKWHSQLLLRFLSGEKAIKKFALKTPPNDQETHSFLIHQFQLEFIENDSQFFEALYQRCEKAGLLRPLKAPQLPEQQQVIRHVQNGETELALDVLQQALASNAEAAQQAVHLSGRFQHLEQQQNKGIVDFRDYTIEFNKIIDALLELNKQLAA